MTVMSPFVDFYSKNDISPVHQDISDLNRHRERRRYLYRSLGIVPRMVAGRSVIEFGPGSGHNAIYTAGLHPSIYRLVDGNPKGLGEACELLASHGLDSSVRPHLGNIEDWPSAPGYDLVLCEGVLSHHADPVSLLKHVAGNVIPGGILVITTADYVGMVPEVLRRLIKCSLVSPKAPLAEQLDAIRTVFESHYETLTSRSRPLDDWLTDTLVMPWQGKLLTIPDAISTLDGEFEVLGGSPLFWTDWAWYKDCPSINDQVIKSHQYYGGAFIDCRNSGWSLNRPALNDLAIELFHAMQAIEREERPVDMAAPVAKRLAGELADGTRAKAGILEAADYLERGGIPVFRELAPLFGRPQQYLSFVRHDA